jgi:hypothetical protein
MFMQLPPREQRGRDSRYFLAAEDASRLLDESPGIVDRAAGVDWYERPGSDVDRALFALCKLRRARSGEKGSPQHGDEAVRIALDGVSQPALVWLVSRAVAYVDETGFPEAVEPWFPDGLEAFS